MSRLVARILLAVLIIPTALLFYLISYLLLDRNTSMSSPGVMLLCGGATWALIDGWWFLLWRGVVQWTRRRRRLTVWALGLSVLAGGLMSWPIREIIDEDVGVFVGTMSAAILWCLASVVLWRETAGECAQRLARSGGDTLVCPACGYNLTGLRESRCPECGASYTLDELIAGQPSRAPAEVETA